MEIVALKKEDWNELKSSNIYPLLFEEYEKKSLKFEDRKLKGMKIKLKHIKGMMGDKEIEKMEEFKKVCIESEVDSVLIKVKGIWIEVF